MKSLSLAEPGCECIPSSSLVVMELRLLAREQAKPVMITVGEVPRQEGRVMKSIGKMLLMGASLYFLIHILIWAVKG